MATLLRAKLRTRTGKSAAAQARRNGMVPAVIYARGEETRQLLVNEREFSRLLESIKGKSTIIDLQIEDEAPVRCIIKAIQRHSVTLQLSHVDFQKIHRDEKLTINVPIHLTGTPIGIKMGGLLDHVLRELPIRGLPDNLPPEVTLDISHLKLGASVHVSDIVLKDVEILLPPTTPIASVLAPKKVEEVTPAAAAAPAAGEEPKEPEVISEKKAQERAAERAKAEAEGGKAAKEEKK